MAKDLDFAGGIVQIDEHTAVAHRPNAARDPYQILGFDTSGEPGIAFLESERLVAALEAVGLGIDPEHLEAIALSDPHCP